MVAGGQQPLLAGIPQSERKHAAQMIEQPVAIRLIQSNDDFAVAVGDEPMTACLELCGLADQSAEPTHYRANA